MQLPVLVVSPAASFHHAVLLPFSFSSSSFRLLLFPWLNADLSSSTIIILGRGLPSFTHCLCLRRRCQSVSVRTGYCLAGTLLCVVLYSLPLSPSCLVVWNVHLFILIPASFLFSYTVGAQCASETILPTPRSLDSSHLNGQPICPFNLPPSRSSRPFNSPP